MQVITALLFKAGQIEFGGFDVRPTIRFDRKSIFFF
jgi:hypothetical protein